MSQEQNFDTLDYDQQIACFDQLAREALEFYGMGSAAFELAAYTENAVYRVTTAPDGEDYALRFFLGGNMPPRWISSQLTWLNALAHDARLRVPQPVGSLFNGRLPSYNKPVYGMLLRWIPGTATLTEELRPGQLWGIGAFAAEMHAYAKRFKPPTDFQRPRLDWEGLFGNASLYHSGESVTFFDAEQHTVIDAISACVREVMNRQGRGFEVFGMIHGDLIGKNILFDGPAIGVVDFDYCGYGYYLYDLTPILWSSRGQPFYADYLDALWEGYTDKRDLPREYQDDLEVFVAARHVASCRWVVMNAEHPAIRGRAPDIVAGRVQEMRKWLDTGHW